MKPALNEAAAAGGNGFYLVSASTDWAEGASVTGEALHCKKCIIFRAEQHTLFTGYGENLKIIMLMSIAVLAGCAGNFGIVSMGQDTYIVSCQASTAFHLWESKSRSYYRGKPVLQFKEEVIAGRQRKRSTAAFNFKQIPKG